MEPLFIDGLSKELARQSRVPIRNRLYHVLKTAIIDGRLASLAKLPSSRELATTLKIGRNTVTHAYEQLHAEGYLITRHGSGSFVAKIDPHQKAPFSKTKSSSAARRSPLKNQTELDYSDPRYPRLQPLMSGSPDLDLFPREDWIRIYNRYIRRSSYSILHYGHDIGYKPLRDAIATHLAAYRGVTCDSDQILILCGSQQGIDLCAQILCRQEDIAIIENPTYDGIRHSLRHRRINVAPIDVDHDGLIVSKVATTAPNARLAIITPSHQFPIGARLSAARRFELIRWANESGSWILEDDYDSEYRYAGQPIQAMQGIDNTGRVLYLGSFSKSLFPDLRIGYLVLPSNLVDRFAEVRSINAGSPPVALQATLATFMEEGRYHKHLRKTRKAYQAKRDYLIGRIERYCGDAIEIGPVDGGMHLTVFLKIDRSDRAISERARELGFAFPPLSRYASKPLKRGGFVLGFSSYSEQQIENAVRGLARAIE